MSGGDPVATIRATAKDPKRQATQLWQEGLELTLSGDVETAIDLYQQSIALHPTAEAYAFWGWALSSEGKLDEAISMCHEAIKIDPDFGNSYNDIGAYLEVQGRRDEAIAWFKRAKEARQYDHREFPYLNLARIYILQKRWGEALLELQAAEVLAPRDERVDMLIARVAENLT
ncbi:TPA: hypothetical protein DDZ10_02665 [Candidatus Uhrbacteria bacterium]|nr:hypothetical protein [Candidatus Uhrbacteria bacterium]